MPSTTATPRGAKREHTGPVRPAVDQALRAGTAPMAIAAQVGCTRQYVYMRRAALGLGGRRRAATRTASAPRAVTPSGNGRHGSLAALQAEMARMTREVATLKSRRGALARRRNALDHDLDVLDARIVALEGRAPAGRAARRGTRAVAAGA